MKKQNRDVAPGDRTKKPLRRLILHRETIQNLNDPLLGGVLGGLAAHTFTGANNNQNLVTDPDGAGTMCG